jgi:hypothetical protein
MKKAETNKKAAKKNQVKISRKKAISRLGLTALSAATMMLLLNDPAKGQDSPASPDNPPVWP